jgi:molybdate transport system substrate-binding protein
VKAFVFRQLALTLLIPCVTGCYGTKAPVGSGREVRVAAAADLKFAFEDISSAFRRQHADIAVTVTYGSSGNLFTQLTNEAPFDLFLSADMSFPRQLMEQGRAEKDSEFRYAVGHLVVWVPNGSALDVNQLGIRAVAEPTVRKIAIANPRFAPYGRAAEAALKHVGVYEPVKDRLVFGDNIAQTAQFVESGAADVGIIALSLALAPTMKGKGHFSEVPPEAYPRLEQGGVVLNWATDKEAARALRDFLIGPDGRTILSKYGFRQSGG